jgi:hypothetical protein
MWKVSMGRLPQIAGPGSRYEVKREYGLKTKESMLSRE